jgi:hypothetical protein
MLGGKQGFMQANTRLEVVHPLKGLEWLCMDLKFNSTLKKHKFRWQSFDVWADQRQLG